MSGVAAIVVIGDEVLEGSTTDTNSGWLCRQINGRGAQVAGIYAVPDDQERIGLALSQAFALKVDLVITVGGLGPTRDDLTLSAISEHTQCPLRTNDFARQWVTQRYQELMAAGQASSTQSENSRLAREKMAQLPTGSEALPNEVGVAPAVHLPFSGGGILALPGVPRELKHIVLHHASEVFQRWLGVGHFRSVTMVTSTNDESTLDGALREFYSVPTDGLYLKSRARKFGEEARMTVTLSAKGTDLSTVNKLLNLSTQRFRYSLSTRDIYILSIESEGTELEGIQPESIDVEKLVR